MTVIAARVLADRIEFAADNLTSQLNRKVLDAEIYTGKLFQVNEMTIGGAGFRFCSQWFYLYCKTRRPDDCNEYAVADFMLGFCEWMKKKDSSFNNENNFLVAYESKLFTVHSNLAVFDVPQFTAIGSGSSFAIAAMHLGKTPREACQVACDLDHFCGGSIQSVQHTVRKATHE